MDFPQHLLSNNTMGSLLQGLHNKTQVYIRQVRTIGRFPSYELRHIPAGETLVTAFQLFILLQQLTRT